MAKKYFILWPVGILSRESCQLCYLCISLTHDYTAVYYVRDEVSTGCQPVEVLTIVAVYICRRGSTFPV